MTEGEREADARLAWTMRLWAVEEGGQKPWPAFRRVWRMTGNGRCVLRKGARVRPGQLL